MMIQYVSAALRMCSREHRILKQAHQREAVSDLSQ